MQVKFKYGCGPIIIGEVIALALRKCIENDSFIHILDLVYMFLAHLSQRLNLAIVIVICLSFYVINIKEQFLAGLHKVHPAYRMVNAGRAGGRL